MEFFQVVDPVTLEPTSWAHVALELVLTVACAVLLGACLQVLPEKLVRRSKMVRAKVPGAFTKEAAIPATKPAVSPKSPISGPATPATTATALSTTPAKTPSPKATPAHTSVVAASTLNDVLESFFEGESLLDEALLDATAPFALPNEGTPTAKPTPLRDPKRISNGTSAFSKELSSRMTTGLHSQSHPAALVPPLKGTSKPAGAHDTMEKNLEDVLDAYMAEEQLLDEAMLDSALEAAQKR
ncbi:hypothetical protein JKF63_05535 [Porcisia hertigi]|uniref:Transmembrane protein n=1 Tax=Porcisia hertigi TaxID=2761500 RepID=A0A836LDQ5_9TRYP|nr:hypothetical protein JKF63_05535 [Porcisia hertigi]